MTINAFIKDFTAEEFFFRCFAYQRNTPAIDNTFIWGYNALGNTPQVKEYAYTEATIAGTAALALKNILL